MVLETVHNLLFVSMNKDAAALKRITSRLYQRAGVKRPWIVSAARTVVIIAHRERRSIPPQLWAAIRQLEIGVLIHAEKVNRWKRTTHAIGRKPVNRQALARLLTRVLSHDKQG